MISEAILGNELNTNIRQANEVRLFEAQKQLTQINQLIEEVDRFQKSNVYSLLKSELEGEYQKYFREATKADDAHIAKANLDKMKGIGFAMGALDRVGLGLNDDADALMDEIKNLEIETEK